MRRLAVFDLDGTLVDTNLVDNRCYERALCEVLALPSLDRSWNYRHVSDTGIAIEAYTACFGRAPSDDELTRATARFLELLAEEHALDDAQFAPMAGAAAILAELPRRGWAVAIATGCWRRSAEFKLQVAGIDAREIPFASTEDGPAR